MFEYFNHTTLGIVDISVGKLGFSFCYRSNKKRIHKGFFRRFGIYWDRRLISYLERKRYGNS